MREPIVAGYPVALRLPQSRFRDPRDVIILIGGGAVLAALLISAAGACSVPARRCRPWSGTASPARRWWAWPKWRCAPARPPS
jgi:hypothetical protein